MSGFSQYTNPTIYLEDEHGEIIASKRSTWHEYPIHALNLINCNCKENDIIYKKYRCYVIISSRANVRNKWKIKD